MNLFRQSDSRQA